MPQKYDTPVWTRAKWRTERDKGAKKKDASGLCSKVNIGERLDKYHKAFASDPFGKAVVEAQKLKADLKTYSAAVKATYPDLDKVVKRLDFQVDQYLQFVDDVEKAQRDFDAALKKVKKRLELDEPSKEFKKLFTELNGYFAALAFVDDRFGKGALATLQKNVGLLENDEMEWPQMQDRIRQFLAQY